MSCYPARTAHAIRPRFLEALRVSRIGKRFLTWILYFNGRRTYSRSVLILNSSPIL